MSRIGKHPVAVPSGVQVSVSGQTVTARGKLGQLSVDIVDDIAVAMDDGRITVNPRSNSRFARDMWATSRTLINNIVVGVDKGFTTNLEINGVGYRVAVQGKELVLQLGYSHEIRYPIPDGVRMVAEKPTTISITGHDKQQIGQIAAEIRGMRPPEPFKGKGIKYETETILRKEGKKK